VHESVDVCVFECVCVNMFCMCGRENRCGRIPLSLPAAYLGGMCNVHESVDVCVFVCVCVNMFCMCGRENRCGRIPLSLPAA